MLPPVPIITYRNFIRVQAVQHIETLTAATPKDGVAIITNFLLSINLTLLLYCGGSVNNKEFWEELHSRGARRVFDDLSGYGKLN